MGEVVRMMIAGQERELTAKEYQGQRVVTFRDIDELHKRPADTAARNFGFHRRKFIEGTDFFALSYEEAKAADFVELPSRNGLTLITESGYLMIVKSLTDDLAWDVQRKLVHAYFRVKELVAPAPALPSSTLDLFELAVKGMREQQEQINRLEESNRTMAQQTAVLEHRLTNLDLTNIEGTPRQRLVKMVQRYAYQEGIAYPAAWRAFDTAFNTAYRTNLTARRRNHAAAKGKKRTDRPEYLEAAGQIEDAIRVADKMLNGGARLQANG